MARNALSPFGDWYGGDPFLALQRQMNRLFDDAWRGTPTTSGQMPSGGMVEARLNVSET